MYYSVQDVDLWMDWVRIDPYPFSLMDLVWIGSYPTSA